MVADLSCQSRDNLDPIALEINARGRAGTNALVGHAHRHTRAADNPGPSGARSCVHPHLSDLDQLEAKRLDPVQQAVQRGLVCELSSQDRLGRLDRRVEFGERGKHRIADPALDPDLIAGGCHFDGHCRAREGEPSSPGEGERSPDIACSPRSLQLHTT